MQPNQPISNPQADRLPARTAAPGGTPPPAFKPGNGNVDSLAEMAQRDLDAALQLLAYRAQYITGASGAAIALRRDGRNDMLCRASTGSSAPELGALLSTEFGLSGESVRTRKLLRCDDAERDARVNRVACRQLGIASVVVMPVVNDEEVLGVFELFSGKANAFGERDVSAVERLSEMVETAVRLARAAAVVPEQLQLPEILAPSTPSSAAAEKVEAGSTEEILDEAIFTDSGAQAPAEFAAPVVESPKVEAVQAGASAVAPLAQAAQAGASTSASPPAQSTVTPAPPVEAPPVKKLFWSAARTAEPAPEKPAEADQSHVPPVLRGLRKCEACGFPVTAGRVLCVECEEKKWRGQLRRR